MANMFISGQVVSDVLNVYGVPQLQGSKVEE